MAGSTYRHPTAATGSNIFGRPPRTMTSATLRLIAVLLGCAAPALGYTERGILKLDNTFVPPCHPPTRQLAAPCPRPALTVPAPHSTFDRVVDGSRNAFVRFDKEYSYGDEHDAWKEFAKTVGESAADLLSCDVGVSGAQ